MPECAVYDVADASHPAAPVDIAGYDPVIPHQTGSVIPSYDCHPAIQCVYDDEERDGGPGDVESGSRHSINCNFC